MTRRCLVPCVAASLLVGCLSFGEDVETAAPSPAQVARCRSEMHLAPALSIEPRGFKLTQGIDDAIWFKFVTARQPAARLFRPDVDVSLFKPGVALQPAMTPWWDAQGKRLVGGQVSLPSARYMTVGIEERGEQMTVYIMWAET
jgi:hypothetical protein